MTRSHDANAQDTIRKVVVKAYDADGRVTYESQPPRNIALVSACPAGTHTHHDAIGRVVRSLQARCPRPARSATPMTS